MGITRAGPSTGLTTWSGARDSANPGLSRREHGTPGGKLAGARPMACFTPYAFRRLLPRLTRLCCVSIMTAPPML